MAVSYNQEFGHWQVNNAGSYPTREAAEAADTAGPTVGRDLSWESTDFADAFTTQPNPAVKAPAPRATSPDGLTYLDTGEFTPLYHDRRRSMIDPTFESRETGFVPDDVRDPNSKYKFDAVQGLYYTEDRHGRRVYVGNDPARQDMAEKTPIFTMSDDPFQPLSAGSGEVPGRQGTEEEALAKNLDYLATGSSATGPAGAGGGGSGGGAGAGGPSGTREGLPSNRTDEAGSAATDVMDENRAENDGLWADARARYDDLGPADYGLSDEARGFQREGLQQQRELLERVLGFDPNAYASQFSDRSLARTIAAGRSAGGGYAAQQAGMMAAMDKAPALYAEGAREAAQLENQRLGMAQGITKSFGDLGTMTRGQDETRAQFDAELPLEIANSVSALTQGQVTLNQQESQMFADMWLDFAQLQSVYAGMDSDEQVAWWQVEAQKRGQDKQLQAVLASLKADGAITSKDIMGGLFQLGGGLIGAGGQIGAAYAASDNNDKQQTGT